MEENQNQQSAPAPVQPEQQAVQAVAPPVVPEASPVAPLAPMTPAPEKKSSKLLLIVVIVLVLFIAGAAAAWFAFRDDEKKSASTDTSQKSTEETKPAEETSSQFITTTFTSALKAGNRVTVEHPEGWTINTTIDKDYYSPGRDRNYVTIGSPAGHYLHISDIDGIGGDCMPDEDTYTLVKKIATKTENVYFTEYVVGGQSRGLGLEYIGKVDEMEPNNDKHVALTEGQSNTNVCNLAFYPIYGGYVNLLDSAATNRFGEPSLKFDDIKDDEAFIKMLQSFDATDTTER